MAELKHPLVVWMERFPSTLLGALLGLLIVTSGLYVSIAGADWGFKVWVVMFAAVLMIYVLLTARRVEEHQRALAPFLKVTDPEEQAWRETVRQWGQLIDYHSTASDLLDNLPQRTSDPENPWYRDWMNLVSNLVIEVRNLGAKLPPDVNGLIFNPSPAGPFKERPPFSGPTDFTTRVQECLKLETGLRQSLDRFNERVCEADKRIKERARSTGTLIS
jgi:hypothetical protein